MERMPATPKVLSAASSSFIETVAICVIVGDAVPIGCVGGASCTVAFGKVGEAPAAVGAPGVASRIVGAGAPGAPAPAVLS